MLRKVCGACGTSWSRRRFLRNAAVSAAAATLAACGPNARHQPGVAGPETDFSATPRDVGAVATTEAAVATTQLYASPTTLGPPPPTSAPLPVARLVDLSKNSAKAPAFRRVETTDNVVFLTIDDGVEFRDPEVIDLLAAKKVPFSMFLVPDFVRADPGYFKRLVELGGTVQNHTVTHVELTKVDAARQSAEIGRCSAELPELLGQKPTLFRPPYGSYNTETLYQTRKANCGALVHWTARMNDKRIETEGNRPLKSGDIILSHFRGDLWVNLDLMFRTIEAQGLRLGRLEEYLRW